MNEPSPKSCSSWAEVTEAFDSFPHQRLGRDIDWEFDEALWIFRGHKSAEYRLEPSIEREVATKPLSWPALEVKILEEFQSRAQMHLSPSDVPKPEDRLSRLALMQHYGIPTRLLNFTLSPYVALYFALKADAEDEAWGYYDAKAAPVLRVKSGDTVEIMLSFRAQRGICF